jgi:Tfp pilus assembly protein FimT
MTICSPRAVHCCKRGVPSGRIFLNLSKPEAAGFSLLEMLIVVAICMIVAAITIIGIGTAARSIRLHGAALDYANLLQNARIQAVKDDKFYTVRTDTTANPPTAFIDINSNGSYDAGEPRMLFRSGTTPQPYAAGPAAANLKTQFLPATPLALASVATTAAGPTFGPRGLPCTPTPSAGGSTTCPFLTPTSFITFIQGTGGDWVAVTVTPASRIRQWHYDSNANWRPLD